MMTENALDENAALGAGGPRDSFTSSTHEISLAHIWMDDDGDSADRPPSAAAMSTPLMRGLLEDSLQQLFPAATGMPSADGSPLAPTARNACDGDASAPLEFEDEEMHALLPMLSDTSFDYDCQDDSVIPPQNVVNENASPKAKSSEKDSSAISRLRKRITPMLVQTDECNL
ncbi:hypothetical protein ATCC90586_010262 [Pythium insidiosum]|nr:hypothetical protein ATCC90586_010262 [Pythium insidiosum]